MRMLCALSMAVSVAALVVSLLRNRTYDVDYPSLLVSVLSVIVTVLIGWHIVDYLALRRNIEERIDTRLTSMMNGFQTVLDGIVRLNLHSHYLKGDCALLTDNCFECLRRISKCGDKTLRRVATDTVMELMRELSVQYKDTYSIYGGKRSLYLYILSQFDCPHREDIEKSLADSREVSCVTDKIDFLSAMTDEDVDDIWRKSDIG